MSTSKKLVELKTKKTEASVEGFIAAVPGEEKQKDCLAILKIMKQITKLEPAIWGGRIIGFGKYIYESPATGRSGEWFITGFSPTKQNLTVYFITGFKPYEDLMKKLGKHKTGGGCLYINKLSDVDIKVLKELITRSFGEMKKKYGKQFVNDKNK